MLGVVCASNTSCRGAPNTRVIAISRRSAGRVSESGEDDAQRVFAATHGTFSQRSGLGYAVREVGHADACYEALTVVAR